ncbi:unnamed protein product [Rotaria sordida]|uniref:EGF-like domain-containing protein n=1 Tax=Rotaria sordida TaxID=392033 RepID=A0A813RUL4_9BILA|nr:unnamed protein product [Rotaria sordida]CAF0790217.1 unnamed protein product [Rotaria sordida]CAF0791614.1 unnamed protein product [Rotaria sordida]
MVYQIFSLIFIFILIIDNVHTTSIVKRGNEVFQLLKETKEKVKHGTQCLPPSKYFAGSCYTYMTMLPATSWERAYNNCLILPTAKDARLLVIDSIAEYEFVQRELIGPKSGSDSVSVYVGLRKVNDTWLWSNDMPLKETPVYRFWVDNNKDILAYDCGVLWLARNTSVLTAAACAEQALRPYVCKHTIDRCYNNSGGCGKYGTCLNLPLLNSYRCQCRFLYAGDRCEKWSSQGLQAIIGGIIIIIACIGSYIINLDRSGDQWSFRKSTAEHYQTASVYGQSRPTSYMPRSPNATDQIILNPCLPTHPDFLDISITNEKHHRHILSSSSSSSSTPPPIPPPIERKHRYSFRRSIQEFEVTSHIHNLFNKPQRLLLFILPIMLTISICVIIVHSRHYIKNNILYSSYSNSTRLFEFCTLYDNNYYVNLVTLPIAMVIIILIICNQTRTNYFQLNKKKFSIFIPIPFNPFSKVNRFDTMILSGIVSHEILQIIEEIFLKATQMKVLTMRGPLFDLIRQIGLVIIIGMRYYPVYTVIEMLNANVLYYTLCALYMWIDLIFRIIEQSYCVDIGPLIKTWHRMQQFKNELTSKLATNSLITTTTMIMNLEHEDSFSEGGGGSLKGNFQKFRDRIPIRRLRTSSITNLPVIQSNSMNMNHFHSLNWSSIYLNFSSIDRNESQSTFDQFNIDSSIIGILKYAPYYLCLTYICLRLTSLSISKLYNLFYYCNKELNNSQKQSLKHIYHEPDINSCQKLSIEYRYVRHLFQKTKRILIENNKKISFIKSLLYKIYRPNKYFSYSKQILNMYMIAFMLTYYLTFNILQGGFYIIEKIYSIFSIPLIVLTDEIDLPQPKPFNLKYEIIIACFLTAIIYYGQLLWGMKNYQKHMLDVYKGKFIDIPPRTAFKSARLISQHAHYPGYCLAYLGFGYITMGNILFVVIIIFRVIFKNLFLVEQIAKVVIPILVIYLSKCILIWFLSKTFFLQRHGGTIGLNNLRSFFVFAYFNFFFDCFLGFVSCGFRVTKATIAAILFFPRLDYCIFGRTLEKMDSGFISYVSFIHMECLHTHPVLVYYCSLINDKIDKRYEYLRSNKREMRHTEMYAYTRRQRAIFRWWLAYTLIRNIHLVQLRKYQVINLQLPPAESFNEFLERKVFNRFQTITSTKFSLTKNQATLPIGGILDSNTIIRNQTTTCTSLLLGIDENDERKPSF